jgi:hypothetical protein
MTEFADPTVDNSEAYGGLGESAESQQEDPIFEWGELPEKPKRTGGAGRAVSERWQKVASLLRDNSGEWAKVAEHEKDTTAANHAARVRNGKSRAFVPAGHYQAVTRPAGTEDEPTYAVWVRHVGAPQPAESVNTDGVNTPPSEVLAESN